MGIAGQHMHRLYFITAHLELDHLIGSDFTLLNQAVTRNDDEELPFCVVPVLSLCYSGLTDIHTELAVVERFQKFGKASAVVTVHL